LSHLARRGALAPSCRIAKGVEFIESEGNGSPSNEQ
jgi:hypothetical protein